MLCKQRLALSIFVSFFSMCVDIQTSESVSTHVQTALKIFADFIETGEPFTLVEFFSLDAIPMPPELKKALERVIITERSLAISLEKQTAILQFAVELFGQRIIAKLRIGLEYPGRAKKEPELEVKRISYNQNQLSTMVDIVVPSGAVNDGPETQSTYGKSKSNITDSDKKWIEIVKKEYEAKGAEGVAHYFQQTSTPQEKQEIFLEILPEAQRKAVERELHKASASVPHKSTKQLASDITQEEDTDAPKKKIVIVDNWDIYRLEQAWENNRIDSIGVARLIMENKLDDDTLEQFLENRSDDELTQMNDAFGDVSDKPTWKPAAIKLSKVHQSEFDQLIKSKDTDGIVRMILENKISPELLIDEQKGLLLAEKDIEAILQRVREVQQEKVRQEKLEGLKSRTPEKVFERLMQKKTLENQLKKAEARVKESIRIVTDVKKTAQSLKENAITKIKSITPKFSLLLGLPGTFKFAEIDARLKPLDLVQFHKVALIISQGEYLEPDFGIKVGKGLNITGSAKIAGPIERISNLIGKELTTLTMQGLIDPVIFGSRLSAILPGKLSFGKNIRTSGLKLHLYIKEVGLTVGIETGLEIKPPKQDEWLEFVGEISVAPEKASLEFNMKGMWENVFGIPGPKIGNVKFKATTDYTIAAATEGILALSGIGLGGEIGIGSKSVEVNVYGEISTTEDILISGEIKGGIFIDDIVTFALTIVEASARTAQLVGTLAEKDIDISNIKKFRKTIEENIPQLGFEKAYFSMSPKVMFFGGKKYDGIEFDLITNVLDKKLTLHMKLDKTGIEGLGAISEITIGPISITGAGSDKTRGTQDDGPVVSLMIKPIEGKAALFLSGAIDAYLFGKHISAEALLDISPLGIHTRFAQDIGIFGIDLELSAKLKEPKDFFIKARMQQDALDKLSELLEKGAQEIAIRADRDIDRAKQEVQKAYEKVQKAKEHIKELKAQRDAIEAENKARIARARAKIEQDVAQYEKTKSELDNAVRACKGQAPREASADIDQKSSIRESSFDEQQALDELVKLGLNRDQIGAVQYEIKRMK